MIKKRNPTASCSSVSDEGDETTHIVYEAHPTCITILFISEAFYWCCDDGHEFTFVDDNFSSHVMKRMLEDGLYEGNMNAT